MMHGIHTRGLIDTGTPDTTDRTVLSCLVWRCELSRPDHQRQVRSASECVGRRRHCQCDRWTHSDAERAVERSGRLNSHRLTRHRQHCLVASGGRCELGLNLQLTKLSVTTSCSTRDQRGQKPASARSRK